MKFSGKLLTGFLVMLMLLSMTLIAACDDDDDDEATKPTETSQPTETTEPTGTTQPTETTPAVTELTIKLGSMTDKTGVASQALTNVDAALFDNLRYFEEQGLIPDVVTLDLVEFDTGYEQSRFIPGYEWLKEKGSDILLSSVPGSGEILKTRLDEEEMVFFMLMATPPLFEPPGYVYSVNITSDAIMYTMLDWLANNDPNFPKDRPAKLGGMGMEDPYVQGWLDGIEDYCDAHPDKWEFEEGIVVGWSTLTFAPEIDALKDCDYIVPPSTGFALPNFMREFRQAGHDATFIGNDAQIAYYGLMKDGAGWDIMDGMYFCLPYTWYGETRDTEVIDIINYVFDNYHTEGEKDILLWSGGAYRGGFTQWRGFLLLLTQAIEELGLGGFNTNSFYEWLQGASITIDGNVWDYSETDRQSWNSMAMYQADGDAESLVRVDDGWFPVIFEP